MYSLNNLFKLNDLKTKHENFEDLSAERLEIYLRKYEKLVNDAKLLESLSDKGEKLKGQLQKIQMLMSQKSKTDKNETNSEDDKVPEPVETSETTIKVLEEIQNKVESLKVDPESSQKPTTTNSNYFANVSEKTKTTIDTEKLKQVKQKILANNEKRYKCQSTKEIPVHECFKIVVEYEKKVKELQMKQAAEKLLQGSSNNYNYNLSGDQSDMNKYRESRANRVYDEDEQDQEDELSDDEYDDEYQDRRDKLNQVFKSNVDRNRYKNSKEDELEKLD